MKLVICLILVLFSARALQAKTILAPLGSKPFDLPAGVVCTGNILLNGWKVTNNGQTLQAPPRPRQATPGVDLKPIRLPMSLDHCATMVETVQLLAYLHWPEVVTDSIILRADEPRLVLDGKYLKKSVFQVGDPLHDGSDVCDDTIPDEQAGLETCNVVVPTHLNVQPDKVKFAVFPPGTPPTEPEILLVNEQGIFQEVPRYSVRRVILRKLIAEDALLDARQKVSSVEIIHPEAVASVSCATADCRLKDNLVLIENVKNDVGFIELTFQLQPHVYLQDAKRDIHNTVKVPIPWARCGLTIASGRPLLNVANQNIVLKITGICSHLQEEELWVKINERVYPFNTSILANDALFAVVSLTRMIDTEANFILLHHEHVMAITHIEGQTPPNARPQLSLPGFGEIPFVPTNRPAIIAFTSQVGSKILSLLPRDSYSVSRDELGRTLIKGAAGDDGFVNLRFALKDKGLPPDLQNIPLYEFSETIERRIKPANVPKFVLSANPWIELYCPHDNKQQPLSPGITHSLPFNVQHGCYLLLHAEQLTEEDGGQLLRLKVTVEGLDGRPKPQLGGEQAIKVHAGDVSRKIFLASGSSHFDKVLIMLDVTSEDVANADVPSKASSALQWSLIMGQEHLSFYATASVPAGLFRAADANHSGIIGTSIACLFRLVALNREGVPLPPGLELGLLWSHILGETNSATYGQVSLVSGLGIGVPLGNVGQGTQATIGVHAWAEYEISRAIWGRQHYQNGWGDGSPWGIVFGTGVSFGNIGVSF